MKEKTEAKQEREFVRRPGNAHGVVRQKMMTFRLDIELTEWIEQQRNKGRYINDLIAADKAAHEGGENSNKN